MNLSINEKSAVICLFNVLSANMLDKSEYLYVEENIMLLNPVERYMEEKGIEIGKLEVAKNMLDEGFSIDKVVKITGLPKEDTLKSI